MNLALLLAANSLLVTRIYLQALLGVKKNVRACHAADDHHPAVHWAFDVAHAYRLLGLRSEAPSTKAKSYLQCFVAFLGNVGPFAFGRGSRRYQRNVRCARVLAERPILLDHTTSSFAPQRTFSSTFSMASQPRSPKRTMAQNHALFALPLIAFSTSDSLSHPFERFFPLKPSQWPHPCAASWPRSSSPSPL